MAHSNKDQYTKEASYQQQQQQPKKKKNHTKRPNTAWKWNTIKLHYINQQHLESSSNSLSEREKPKCLSMVSFFLFKKLSLVYPVHSFIGLNMLSHIILLFLLILVCLQCYIWGICVCANFIRDLKCSISVFVLFYLMGCIIVFTSIEILFFY